MGQNPGQNLSKDIVKPVVPTDLTTPSQRQRILDAIASSCAEKTFAATTISDIVGRAGVSRATFYKHFDSKHRCFAAAVDEFVEEVRATGRAAYASASGSPEAVRESIAAMLELMAAAPAYTRLVAIEAVTVDPNLINRLRALLIGALRTARRDIGGAQPSDSATRTAFGQTQVLIANQILAGNGGTLPELLPDLVYILMLPFAGQEQALKQAQLAR